MTRIPKPAALTAKSFALRAISLAGTPGGRSQLVEALRATTERTEEQDWLKTNLAKFARMLQGQRDLVTVGRMLLSELAPLINSQQGTVYQMLAAEPPALSRLAVWEPPYHVDDSAPRLPHDFAARLDTLVRKGRRADAVELFMLEAAAAPAEAVAAMRLQPSWPDAEAVAHTLPYEAAVMGPGNVLPAERLAAISQPALVLTGDHPPASAERRTKTSSGASVFAVSPTIASIVA